MRSFETLLDSFAAARARILAVEPARGVSALVADAAEARAWLRQFEEHCTRGEWRDLQARMDRRIDEHLSRALTTYLEARMEEIAVQARRDPLTGLPDRRAFEDRFRDEAARARRYGRELTLVMFDVDGLKAVNDAEGHSAGDRLLREVAAQLQTSLRRSDAVYRYGGDEFVALYPETSGAAAAIVLRRLEARMETTPAVGGPLGVSWGVASLPADALEDETLLRIADARMYEAKKRKHRRRVAGA